VCVCAARDEWNRWLVRARVSVVLKNTSPADSARGSSSNRSVITAAGRPSSSDATFN